MYCILLAIWLLFVNKLELSWEWCHTVFHPSVRHSVPPSVSLWSTTTIHTYIHTLEWGMQDSWQKWARKAHRACRERWQKTWEASTTEPCWQHNKQYNRTLVCGWSCQHADIISSEIVRCRRLFARWDESLIHRKWWTAIWTYILTLHGVLSLCCISPFHRHLCWGEWVSSFLMAHQHNIGYAVPYY